MHVGGEQSVAVGVFDLDIFSLVPVDGHLYMLDRLVVRVGDFSDYLGIVKVVE